ncbi:MAG: alanine racemase [Bacteroidota bacterium]
MKDWFGQVNQVLRAQERAIPRLLIDLDRLDQNIETFRSSQPAGMGFRIVVKSLPSFPLIQYIMDKAETHKLMVFHQPFLTDLIGKLDEQADVLLGKPMPIKTAEYVFQHLPQGGSDFNAFRQIQWLIDTKSRLAEYLELAKRLQQKLRVNLEIDIGLHRGGFDSDEYFRKALTRIQENRDYLELSGLMGYDPHVVKLPKLLRSAQKAFDLANARYEAFKTILKQEFPDLWSENLCFNGAGSPTVELHQQQGSPCNELSAGSCLVKPTTFDIPTLKAYQAASFIATPVLKSLQGTTLPALEGIKGLLNKLDKANQQSVFIYGGYWKADYHHPKGIKPNALFGESTNQTLLNVPPSENLNVDDFVFLRPRQSEFVFLQFGALLSIRNAEIVETWSLLKNE